MTADSIEYAIISLPFTINRMQLVDVESRITNIAKGKLSEKFFIHFCRVNEIPINTDSCQTQFHLPDKRDFILGREEWDIKNNFLHYDQPILPVNSYLDLPALIPHRGKWDQWTKRKECLHHPETESVCFLFSFMKGWTSKKPFMSIGLSKEQVSFLRGLCKSYKGKYEPCDENWFWIKMSAKGTGKPFQLNLLFNPELLICSYADKKHFTLFEDVYLKTFLKGVFKTRIKN